MKKKTVIEKIKDYEQVLNLLAQIRGFTVVFKDNGNNSGTMIVQRKINKLIFLDFFDISGVFELQIDIKRDERILETALYINDIVRWIYNFIYYGEVDFLFQFHGGRYDNKLMTTQELQKISNTIIRKKAKNKYLNFRDELANLPSIDGYFTPRFSHMDYGIIFFVYNAL